MAVLLMKGVNCEAMIDTTCSYSSLAILSWDQQAMHVSSIWLLAGIWSSNRLWKVIAVVGINH